MDSTATSLSRVGRGKGLWLGAVCWCLLLVSSAPGGECRLGLADALQAGACYELVLDERFADWDRMPVDLRSVRFQAAEHGGAIAAVFVEGNGASRYGRWLLEISAGDAGEVDQLLLSWGDEAEDVGVVAPRRIVGGSAAALRDGNLQDGALQDGRQILGMTLTLKGHGWGAIRDACRLYPGGPTASRAIPMGNDPSAPLIASSAYQPQQIGHFGLRDFHVMTEPGGRACRHDGYYYALVSGHRLSAEQPVRGRKRTDRAVMWTRAKDIDGPWQRPKVLLGAKGPWETVDQGAMVKLSQDAFVLMFRAVVGGTSGLYVMTANSPTAWQLPQAAVAPALDASVLDSVTQPGDYLALPHMIKLTGQSRVGTIPGTDGAFVAYFEVRRLHHRRSKWHVYGAYSTDPRGLTGWTPMLGGRPLCGPDDDPQSAWHAGVANPKIVEVGPGQFVLGINAYGQNPPEHRPLLTGDTDQDWRLWLASSRDCTAFSRNDFRCLISQVDGDGDHAGRIESAHWVLAAGEPPQGPLRVIYFAAPRSVQPETHFCNVYQAFAPPAATVKNLELGVRGHGDRAYLYREIDTDRPWTLELAVDAQDMHRQRGEVFLPAIFDDSDPSRANGLAITRDAEGQFRVVKIEGGEQTTCWDRAGQKFVPIPPAGPDRRLIARLARRLRQPWAVWSAAGLLGLCFGALAVLAFCRPGRWRLKGLLIGSIALTGIGCAVALVLPGIADRSRPASMWYGPKGIQRARIVLTHTESSLSAKVTGPQGQVWLAAELPGLDASMRHLFVGKTSSAGESIIAELEYVLLYPEVRRVSLRDDP